MKNEIWRKVYAFVAANPGDMATVSRGLWFNVSAANGDVFIEKAKSHAYSSKITVKRKLDKANADTVYEAYCKRANSKDCYTITRNYSYWRALFKAMGI